MLLFKRDNLIYTLVAISSCVTYLFGQHAYLSQMMKVILGLSNMAAVWIIINKNMDLRNVLTTCNHSYTIHKICILLIGYAAINIILSLFSAPGRFQTFLFSPFYLLTYLLPLFYVIVEDYDFFEKFFKLYITVAIASLFSLRGFGLTSYFVVIFFPILIKNKKLIVLFSLILLYDLIYSFNIFDTLRDAQRQLGIELAIAALTVYVVWLRRNIRLAKLISWVLCIIPIVIWVLFLIYNISVFEIFSQNVEDAIMSLDTRTFLYEEFFANLDSMKDWLLGFGLDGGYYSQWFMADYNTGGRETIEVTMLHLMLKGGLLLLIAYIIVIAKAIINGFKYGQNKLVYACCLMLSGHLVCMCVGDYPSRSLLIQIMPFIMVGICTSERVLDLSDDDLEDILYLQ